MVQSSLKMKLTEAYKALKLWILRIFFEIFESLRNKTFENSADRVKFILDELYK